MRRKKPLAITREWRIACYCFCSRSRAISRDHKLVSRRPKMIRWFFVIDLFLYVCVSHYRRAAGALVVYDVTNKESFDNAQQHWLKELRASADLSSTLTACIMLVGNKVDLEAAVPAAQCVPSELHETAAQQLFLKENRVSAKTCLNVRKALEELIFCECCC